jgi:uncharacterized protein (TIGR00251 family)
MRSPDKADSALLRVRVHPRASKAEVLGWDGAALRVRVTAAPIGGEANEAVRVLLARSFRVPLSAVMLVRGARGRDKLIRVQGLSREALEARIKTGPL